LKAKPRNELFEILCKEESVILAFSALGLQDIKDLTPSMA